MADAFHCPKCQIDLRHSLEQHGGALARCPYCACPLRPPNGTAPTQTLGSSASQTRPKSDQNITNEPPAAKPAERITAKPRLRQRHHAADDDHPPKQIRRRSSRNRSAVLGLLAGMGTGLAIGILCGGVCTTTSTGPLEREIFLAISVVAAVGLTYAGAVIGAVVGYFKADQAVPNDEQHKTSSK
jgi:hypothetical protein